MKRLFCIVLLLCSFVLAENPYRTYNNFNAGELSPLLSAREDLAKYQSGCSVMENVIPAPQGGAVKRPGTKYIASVKTPSLSTRLLPFEYSTSQSYIIEAGNQYMRFFTDGAAVLTGVGTETLTTVDSNDLVGHWKLNDDSTNTTVVDAEGTQNGTATTTTDILHYAGFVGSGCFDLDEQYAVSAADNAAFSFDDSSNGSFSITAWANITYTGSTQVLLSKWDETTDSEAREWRLSLDADRKVQLHLCDNTVGISGDVVAQWKLNEDANDTTVLDTTANNHDGATQTSNTGALTETGQLSTCLNLGKVGNDAVVITTDANGLSFDDANDEPFSIASWAYVTTTANAQVILSKWAETTASQDREWLLHIQSDNKIKFIINDENVAASPDEMKIITDAGVSDGWHFIVATYDGSGGVTASDGMKIYVDGYLVDSTAYYNANYTQMRNGATKVVIGAYYNTAAALALYWKSKIDNVALLDIELTAALVLSLWNDGSGTENFGATATISAVATTAVDYGWHFIAATYNGAHASWSSATAANYITLYVDGAALTSTKNNNAEYVAMDNTGAAVLIGAQESTAGTNEFYWADKIDNVALFKDVLLVAELSASPLYSTTQYEITTPFLTADLFEIKYEQSADVLYLTHPDYETRKLIRYNDNDWVLSAIALDSGPFRTQNSTVTKTITASATTGSVTLTASGCTPFVANTTAGHVPSGSAATSKSQTGALFKLVHPIDTLEYSGSLTAVSVTENTGWIDCGTLYKGTEWTLVTNDSWVGAIEVQRNYTIGAAYAATGWETVLLYTGLVARNVSTTGSEDDGDADYRIVATAYTSGTIRVYFSTDQVEHIGIVEITAVTSNTSATGTVVETLASTDATHKWAEGSWSNYRGWPQTVTFFEDRLCFGGNTSQPDTIWGSVTSEYENMKAGADDDDAIAFTLSSRQVNVIEWLIGKDKIMIGTSGAEWTLEGGADEPLTPSNVIAKQHSTYGSANLQATLANESVLFFQRGKEKMRELAYNWEVDSYVAPEMTILANLVTNGGIVDTAFQRIPNSVLWCARADGELPIFSYERAENITAWSRLITTDGTSDSDIESIAVISGSTEDEIWVIVERTIDSNTVRYVEQFQPRDYGSDPCDAYFVDCGVVYDSTAVSYLTGGSHLEGETVYVLADGVVFDSAVVDANGGITLKLSGTVTTAETVQWGLPYAVKIRTMPLSVVSREGTIQGRMKRISEVIARWYLTGDFSIGRDSSNLETYSISGLTTSENRKTFPPGYDRNGYVYVYQLSPEPLNLLGIMTEFNVQ